MRNILSAIITMGFLLWIEFSSDCRSEIIPAVCPPVLKMIGSDPAHNASGVSVAAPIIITLERESLQTLTDNVRDLKPVLESVNIAGGRYGMGTLLTTEWGIGGGVRWEDNIEVITPEKPLEPGTQYRVWTYLYMTIRNKVIEHCPGIGGDIIFRTDGIPPEDMNPVRSFDLSTLYHGDEHGKATLKGVVADINFRLRVISIRDGEKGLLNMVLYEGTPLMRLGEFFSLESLRLGNAVEVSFTGGRVSMVVLLDVE